MRTWRQGRPLRPVMGGHGAHRKPTGNPSQLRTILIMAHQVEGPSTVSTIIGRWFGRGVRRRVGGSPKRCRPGPVVDNLVLSSMNSLTYALLHGAAPIDLQLAQTNGILS